MIILIFLNSCGNNFFRGADARKVSPEPAVKETTPEEFVVPINWRLILICVSLTGERSNTFKAIIGLSIFFLLNNKLKIKYRIMTFDIENYTLEDNFTFQEMYAQHSF